MALRVNRAPLTLIKCIGSSLYLEWLMGNLVPRIAITAGLPVVQKSYATVPIATSPALKPAVRQQSEPKKGVMDYVLTTADAV